MRMAQGAAVAHATVAQGTELGTGITAGREHP